MKPKRLPVSLEDIGELLARFTQAKNDLHAERGVYYLMEKPGCIGDFVGVVTLLRESHHSNEDVKIAAARLNALYFCKQIYVTDLVINKAA